VIEWHKILQKTGLKQGNPRFIIILVLDCHYQTQKMVNKLSKQALIISRCCDHTVSIYHHELRRCFSVA